MSDSSDEMTVTKLAAGLAKTVGNAASVAGFLDRFPVGLTLGQRNRWMMAHLGAHLAWRGTTEILAELANSPVGEQGDLFETPTDHAMAVREVEEFIDRLKEHIVGAVTSWELRVAAETPPADPGLLYPINIRIFTSGAVTFAELEAEYGDAESVRAALDALVAKGTIEEVDGTYRPAGGDVAGLEGDALRATYESEVGKKAGKKSAEQLRAGILDARRRLAEG